MPENGVPFRDDEFANEPSMARLGHGDFPTTLNFDGIPLHIIYNYIPLNIPLTTSNNHYVSVKPLFIVISHKILLNPAKSHEKPY